MSDAHKATPSVSLRNRTIRTGDTTIEVTELEVRLRAVEYLYRPHFAAAMQRRLASVDEVLQTRIPEEQFQVSASGYADMRAKAERICALWRGERF